MSSIDIQAELLEEYNWRIHEIAMIKLLAITRKIAIERREVLRKYSVVSFYALWEGFVKKSFRLYIEAINRLNLSFSQIIASITTSDIDRKFNLRDGRNYFESKSSFCKSLYQYMNSPIILSSKIHTESNMGFKTINKILSIFNMTVFPEREYKNRLNRLLMVRNIAAHGETIIIDDGMINEFSKTVVDSMSELIDRVVEACESERYLAL